MREDLVYGFHAIEQLINSEPHRILEIYCLIDREDQRLKVLREKAEENHIPLQTIHKKQLETWLPNVSHQGVAARCKPKPILTDHDLDIILKDAKKPQLFLVLDGVQDPHNLGACLRSCDATGVTALIVPKDNAAPLNATVSKVAAGAAETVPVIRVNNLARCLENLKKEGVWIMGACGEASASLYQMDLKGSIAFVLGAEQKGLRRLTRETCDYLFSIPMAGAIESLNVSVATGVCLFEAVRQRQLK